MKKISVDISVYTFDIDFAGHVGNNIYLQWVEIGRCKFLEAVGFPIQIAVEKGLIPVVANMNVSYKKPLYLGDKVKLEVWLSELKKLTHVIEFRFYNDEGILAATGYQKGVIINSKTMRPCSMPADIRDLFLPYVDDRSLTA